MFGYLPEELQGKHISNLFDGFSLEKALREYKYCKRKVYKYGRRNKLRYSLSAFPISSSKGEALDILYIFEDIKRKKLVNDTS